MKKMITSIIAILVLLMLVACGQTGDKLKNDTESMGDSVLSKVESETDKIKSDAESTDIMAGITADDAKKAALGDAGIDESGISDLEIDLDRENGNLIYEVEFKSGTDEYEYKIDAQSGKVISKDLNSD